MLAISDFAKAEIWEKSIELLQELESEYRRTFEYAMLSDNLVIFIFDFRRGKLTFFWYLQN